jgi:hypothetical protein
LGVSPTANVGQFSTGDLGGALTQIRKRQQQREEELVRSAKSKREKRIVRDRFADRLPPPGP